MTQVSGILLAAGESRRMGAINKTALLIGERPLLRHSVETLLASELRQLVVVLGYQADDAKKLLKGLDVTLVENKQYQEGQMSSVHCGLQALSTPCTGVMICLTDQPLITAADINFLIDAFSRRAQGSILVPTYRGQRGNPIVLAHEHRTAILSGGRNLGCKRLIEHNPDLVATVEMDNEHVVFDLDTPEDYADLQRRPGYGRFPGEKGLKEADRAAK